MFLYFFLGITTPVTPSPSAYGPDVDTDDTVCDWSCKHSWTQRLMHCWLMHWSQPAWSTDWYNMYRTVEQTGVHWHRHENSHLL